MHRPHPVPQGNQLHPQHQPQPQPQPQMCGMCLLRYNYCPCKGCAKDFAEFQNSVEKKYKVPKPSLDEQNRTITVIGTSDATGLTKLLLKSTKGKKKHVEILPNPKKETSAQPQPPREATNMREEAAGIGRTSTYHVGESSWMGELGHTGVSYGQMEQRGQYQHLRDPDDNEESAWNYVNDENSKSCTIM